MPRPPHVYAALLLLALTLCCLLPARAFSLALPSVRSTPASSGRSGASAASGAALTGSSSFSSSSSSSSLFRLHSTPSPNSESDEKNKRSKRRRRKGTAPLTSSSSTSSSTSSSSSPSLAGPGTARYDATLEELIVDERKSALPRLEDLKILKSGKTVAADMGKTGGKPGILMPRELEEMKQREKAKEATKGAPPYFDTMTKITWGAIAFMVVTEVVVALIPKAATVTPGG